MDMTTNVSRSVCQKTGQYLLIYVWFILYLLLLPLFLFILWVGYSHWRKQSVFSHTDIFTFNIIFFEVLSLTGTWMFVLGLRAVVLMKIGTFLFNVGTSGQMLIHALTCVDRYLAIVHPITYMRLKERGGVRIRSVLLAALWILSFGTRSMLWVAKVSDLTGIVSVSIALVIFAVVFFCSVSALSVLIRPAPGKGGRNLKPHDRAKRRAFNTILVIMGVLLMRIIAFIVEYSEPIWEIAFDHGDCRLAVTFSLLYLPSSLVLPVMFLQKSGKLPKCSSMSCKCL